MKHQNLLFLLASTMLLFSFSFADENTNNPEQQNVKDAFVSDSVITKAENLIGQHQYPAVIELLFPKINLQDSIKSEKEAKATHLLITSLLRMQRPEGFRYLSKLLGYTTQHSPEILQAEYLIHYAEMLTFTKTMYSFKLAERALDLLSEENENTPLKIRAYQTVGKNFLAQGNPRKALEPFYSAIRVSPNDTVSNPFSEQKLYSNLSIAYNMMGQADSALKYSSKAYKIISVLPEVPPMVKTQVLGNLSRALLISGDPDSAIQIRKKVLAINKQLTGDKSTQTGGSYYHLASASFAKGAIDSALNYAQKSILTNYPEIDDSLHYSKMPHPLASNTNVNAVLQGLMLKVSFFEQLYQNSEEKKWLEFSAQHYKAMDTLVNVLQQSVAFETLPMVIKLNNAGYDKAAGVVENYGKLSGKNNIEDVYHFAAATKAKMLAYQIQSMKASEPSSLDTLKQKRAHLEQQLTHLKNEMHIRKESSNTFVSLKTRQLILQTRLIAIIDELARSKAETNKPDVSANPATLSNIRKNLKNDEALIEFIDSGSEIYIFCNTSDHSFFKKAIDTERYNKAYNQYLRGIKTGEALTGGELSELLLKPVYDMISGKKHLILIPDEKLFNLPFEALPLPGNDLMLVEKHTVTYNYSAKLWLNARNSVLPNPEKDLVAIAPGFKDESQASLAIRGAFRDSDLESYEMIFRSGNREMLAPLPFSTEELDEITQMFASAGKKVLKLENEEATEENFRNAPSTDIFHLATHGFSDSENPEKSGLFFTQNESGNYKNDGFIHLNELFELNLNTDLVVLSACKSGSGKILEGEGVFALPRGFIYAGTPNLVASLWKIHDRKTKKLVTFFYEKLISGKSYRKALQEAKLEMISQNELPVDWAGMILIGR